MAIAAVRVQVPPRVHLRRASVHAIQMNAKVKVHALTFLF